MKEALKDFQKTKDFLVCVDSDGCVLDTMDTKHMRCLGPCLIHEWGLEKYKSEIIGLWRKINLVSATRGINRFKGLEKVLTAIHENYKNVEGLDEYAQWVQTTDELSEESLKEAYRKTGNVCIKKAIEWSDLVNRAMNISSGKRTQPFEGVDEALELVKQHADVAIVSAANGQELEREWNAYGIARYVDVIASQESGLKSNCLKQLVDKGYDADKVIMLGDAPLDLEAARAAGVRFYPILAYQELESWRGFEEVFEDFLKGNYTREMEEEKIKAFEENLQ